MQPKPAPCKDDQPTDDALSAHLEQARKLAVNRLLRPNNFANVLGVGIGRKEVEDSPTPTYAIRVYVVSKQDSDDLSPGIVVPADFYEIPTDVIEVGRLSNTGHRPQLHRGDISDISLPGDPIRVSTDAPNVNSGFMGTLGGVLEDEAHKGYILSCNHLLAANGRVPQGTKIVSELTTEKEVPIASFGTFVRLQPDVSNSVDCAVAGVFGDPTDPNKKPASGKWQKRGKKADRVTCAVALNDNKRVDCPCRGMRVAKVGAVTGTTTGSIVDVDAELYVDYSFGTFRFKKQVLIDGGATGPDFARSGDSGSLVVNETGSAVAMIFAASGRYAIACPLQLALDQLGAELKSKLTLITS